jgi:hypothetical protein
VSVGQFMAMWALCLIGTLLIIFNWPDEYASQRAWLLFALGCVCLSPAFAALWVTAVFG